MQKGISLVFAMALLSISPASLAAEWGVSDDASFSVDAVVIHTVTPDVVYMTVECQIQEPMTKAKIYLDRTQKKSKLVTAAGSAVNVRSMGAPMLMQYMEYDDQGQILKSDAMTYTGTFGFSMQLQDGKNAEQLSHVVEEMGCTYLWDARVVQTTKHARQHRAELVKQINERKAFYEEMLGISLNRVTNISTYSYIESPYTYYSNSSSYIPEENSVMVQTTMTVSFDVLKKGKKD